MRYNGDLTKDKYNWIKRLDLKAQHLKQTHYKPTLECLNEGTFMLENGRETGMVMCSGKASLLGVGCESLLKYS